MAGHVFYELAAGVGMPGASFLGGAPAAALWATSSMVALREAGRRPPSQDAAFALLNGFFLSAVLAHLSSWPRTTRAGLPWLVECEGLSGRLMPAYNLLLYVGGIAAAAGLAENRRGTAWGLAVPVVLVPPLRREQHREHARLCARARRQPAWWNRRLQQC